MPNLRLELPPGFMIINTDKITPNVMERIAEALSEVKVKNSPFAKYPILDNETIDQWRERVDKQYEEDHKDDPPQSAKEFVNKLYKVESSQKKMLFDTLVALSNVFGQGGRVTDESFGSGSYTQMKAFVRDVLKACDFDTKDFD